MNRLLAGSVGGAVGALAVTGLHEGLRRIYSGAPRLDQMGKEATAKVVDAVGGNPLSDQRLYYTSMVGDIISNAAYYSGAAAWAKHPVLTGAALGLLAGVGAVKLPSKIGLDPSPTNKQPSRRMITIGLYTVGGLLSGFIISRLTANSKD